MEHLSGTVSATEVVRNFATIIDRVRTRKESIKIMKGSQVVAELVPPPKAGFPMAHFKELYSSLPTLGKDASKMMKDIEKVRQKAKLPKSLWPSS